MNDFSSSIEKLLTHWRNTDEICDNITVWKTDPQKEAQKDYFPDDMHPALIRQLKLEGIHQLYLHQLQCWKYINNGENVVVATGTASGKSLCYHLPIFDQVLKMPSSTSLYLFPTKALAQDQFQFINNFTAQIASSSLAGIYDGDTPIPLRRAIRNQSKLLLTNPDMLHTGILPHHTMWENFFKSLKFVVIDEIHYYRGVFGSHFSNLIRRLHRITDFYGVSPQFILTSATIANPQEHAQRLIQNSVSLVDQDGAPHGQKYFLLYNPPLVNHELGIRQSASSESQRLVSMLIDQKIQTILFVQSRKSVEFLLRNLRLNQPDASNAIKGYRSGYRADQRRITERELREGQARVVVSTNALELGIDIGQLDASIMVGYPGTICSTRQQAGRVGRKNQSSLAVLIASANPIDQFLIHHPEYLFDQNPENALINPDTALILLQHIRCACFELPFQSGDSFGYLPEDVLDDYLQVLTLAGELHKSMDKYYWVADQYPADSVSLRSSSAQPIRLNLQHEGKMKTLGEVDFESAARMVHPGAIYLHEGQAYYVETLNLEKSEALLTQCDPDYYTHPKINEKIDLLEIKNQGEVNGGKKFTGEVMVTSQVIGYENILWSLNQRMDYHELSLPPTKLRTSGFWISISPSTIDQLRNEGLWRSDPNQYGRNWEQQKNITRHRDHYQCQVCGVIENGKSHHVHHRIPFRAFISYLEANQINNLITLCPSCHRKVELSVRIRSGISGLKYVFHQLSPIILMCDHSDLGSFSDPESPLASGNPCVGLYEMIPAGVGFSEMLFNSYKTLLSFSFDLVNQCRCSDGCPSCVGPAPENGSGGKLETRALINALLME